MATRTSQSRRPPPDDLEEPDPYRFGWRRAKPGLRNGKADADGYIPLTPVDLLHPQEHDEIPETTWHERDRGYLANALRLQMGDRPGMRVLSDCLVSWRVRGLRRHGPDISFFERLRDPGWQGGLFRVAKQGARPVLVIEIVSPDAWDKDARDNDVVTKVDHYYRAGVPLYVIIDQKEAGGPRELIGYRHGRHGYVRMKPDAQGRLLLEPVGLLLGMRDNWAVCYDARRGEEIPDMAGMARARQEAEAERAAEARARREAEAALAAAQARIRELEARPRRRR
jgi:Uma2 family endonuclease